MTLSKNALFAAAFVLATGSASLAADPVGVPIAIGKNDWRVVALVDVDVDGDLDVVFRDPENQQVIATQSKRGFTANQPCYCKIVVNDLDGDLSADFQITYDNGREDFALQNDDGTFQVSSYR